MQKLRSARLGEGASGLRRQNVALSLPGKKAYSVKATDTSERQVREGNQSALMAEIYV